MNSKRLTERTVVNQSAFTLIEVLVVIAIIALLAGLVSGLGAHSASKRKIARARAELQQLEAVIENYKSRLGFYPPDNGLMSPTDTNLSFRVSETNQLYYELTGVVFTELGASSTYETFSGSMLHTNAYKIFGRGFVNSGTTRKGVKNFFTSLKGGQHNLATGPEGLQFEMLSLPIDGPLMITNTTQTPTRRFNPWRYNSSYPLNNPTSYDLWTEITIEGKTVVIGNWNSY
jgi:prepilin-type N-terminal cleavage/methylation domain-containing protein